MTSTTIVYGRAVERLAAEHREYVYARGRWHDTKRHPHAFDAEQHARYLREAVVARTSWSLLVHLLREPSWIEQRVNGIDANDLAVMAGAVQ